MSRAVVDLEYLAAQADGFPCRSCGKAWSGSARCHCTGCHSIALEWSAVTGNDTKSMLAGPITLAGGPHTIDLRVKQSGTLGTSTFTVITFQTTALQWGG